MKGKVSQKQIKETKNSPQINKRRSEIKTKKHINEYAIGYIVGRKHKIG